MSDKCPIYETTHSPYPCEQAEQRIAELERQLAEIKDRESRLNNVHIDLIGKYEHLKNELANCKDNQALVDQLCAAAARLPDDDTLYNEYVKLKAELAAKDAELVEITAKWATETIKRKAREAEVSKLRKVKPVEYTISDQEAAQGMKDLIEENKQLRQIIDEDKTDVPAMYKEIAELREGLRTCQYQIHEQDEHYNLMECNGCGASILVEIEEDLPKPDCTPDCWLAKLIGEGK
jgi:chromosome segregation ATPase